MNSLPHELIQLISGCLLPRSQCRFALTSRHHYKYLYTDLLRWHARKQHIPVPRCEIYNGVSIMRSYKAVRVFYINCYDYANLHILNLTTPRDTEFYNGIFMSELSVQFSMHDAFSKIRHLDPLRGNYRNMHKRSIIHYLNMVTLLRLMPYRVRRMILCMLSQSDISALYDAYP